MASNKSKGIEGLEDPIETAGPGMIDTRETDDPLRVGADDDWETGDMEYIENTIETTETMPPEDEEEAETRRIQKGIDDDAEAAADDESDDDEEADVESDEADESDDEDDDEASEDGDEDEDDDDTDDESDEPLIPKHRFDEVNAKRKAAEAEIARIKAEREAELEVEEPVIMQAPDDDFDYDANEDAYQDAVLEGRKDDAKALRREAREAELEHQQAIARFEAQDVTTENNRNTSIKQTAISIESMHPQFSEASETFDPAMTKVALQLSKAYLGMPEYASNPNAALIDAAEQALKIHGYMDKDGNDLAVDDTPVVSKRVKSSKKSQVKAKVKVANSQPTRVKRKAGGIKEVAIDIDNMSDAEFAALPESTKARMRGDFFGQ